MRQIGIHKICHKELSRPAFLLTKLWIHFGNQSFGLKLRVSEVAHEVTQKVHGQTQQFAHIG